MPRTRASGVATAGGDPAARAHHPLLDAINESTKWTVSAAVFATLGVLRDATCAWWVLGSIAAAALCRGLKLTLNHARPANAPKADPGMPSAHANSLGFLSTFVAAWAAAAGGGRVGALSLGVPAGALFLTWLRVSLGYHTVAQVVAGWALGSLIAVGWWVLGVRAALPAAAASPALQAGLYGLTTAAVVFFIVSNGARWVREARVALAKGR